ncbi:hypothetical protein AVEN_212429-1 [Araneus ventricosus]|uniref:Uncharacterized protein n=1 Tax=Araneus ventricosus TaxID=182803 RepID=A0A4Y2S0T1_ARAVE|nr:hypothetical protein AVEN_212429-1 [Araneus ventricosus]
MVLCVNGADNLKTGEPMFMMKKDKGTSEVDLMKNDDRRKLSVSLVHRDRVRYPSATLASATDGRPALIYGEHYLFP